MQSPVGERLTYQVPDSRVGVYQYEVGWVVKVRVARLNEIFLEELRGLDHIHI